LDKKIARTAGRILHDVDYLMEQDKKNYVNTRAKNPAKRYPKGRHEFEKWKKRDKALHKAEKIIENVVNLR
jgi:hypothetical protein